MADRSGENREDRLSAAEVARALERAGLPVREGEPEAMLSQAQFLRGAVRRVRDAS